MNYVPRLPKPSQMFPAAWPHAWPQWRKFVILGPCFNEPGWRFLSLTAFFSTPAMSRRFTSCMSSEQWARGMQ